jgi:hypothetical protein
MEEDKVDLCCGTGGATRCGELILPRKIYDQTSQRKIPSRLSAPGMTEMKIKRFELKTESLETEGRKSLVGRGVEVRRLYMLIPDERLCGGTVRGSRREVSSKCELVSLVSFSFKLSNRKRHYSELTTKANQCLM